MTYLELYRTMEPEVLARTISVGCPNKSVSRLAPVPCLEQIYNPDGKREPRCDECLINLFGQEVPPQVMIDVCSQSKIFNDRKPPDQRPGIGKSMVASYLGSILSGGLLTGNISMPALTEGGGGKQGGGADGTA